MADTLNRASCATPLGEMWLASDGQSLIEILLPSDRRRTEQTAATQRDATLREACRQLRAYFAGELTEFDLPLAPRHPVSNARMAPLCDIPFGEVISYAELARRIGQPTAYRAVGAANGRNPIPIVIPCHRVIGADKSLTGYGGGMEAKKWLLDHETARPAAMVAGAHNV